MKRISRLSKGAVGTAACAIILAGALGAIAFSGSMHDGVSDGDLRDKNWKFDDAVMEAVVSGNGAALLADDGGDQPNQSDSSVLNGRSADGSDSSDSFIDGVVGTQDHDGFVAGKQVEKGRVANQVLIQFDGSLDEKALREHVADMGVQATKVELVSKSLDNNQVLVALSYEGDATPEEVGKELISSGFATTAEPNYVRYFLDEDNQSGAHKASLAIGLKEMTSSENPAVDNSVFQMTIDDPRASSQWALSAIKAYDAWDVAQANRNVTVAVIDSGVDCRHEDLSSNIVQSYAKNTVTGSTGSSAVYDYLGHGTHVAGIVAATTNNGKGVAGVSCNANILPIKVSSGSERSMLNSDVVKAIDYVTALKEGGWPDWLYGELSVINMSLGSDAFSSSEYYAVERAYNAGLTIVAAAGNDAQSKVMYPAAHRQSIAVSALKEASENGVVFDSSYSNYGDRIDIAAPGTNIYSTIPGGYGNKTGTSMASPMVAGVAALVIAVHPGLVPKYVHSVLVDTAKDLGSSGWDRYYGYGALQADKAAKMAKDLKLITEAKVIEFPDSGLVYNGLEQTPKPRLTYNDVELRENADYKLTYYKNISAGEGYVEIAGMGEYSGSFIQWFTIAPRGLDDAMVSSIGRQTYTGTALKPEVTVICESVPLEEGVDYRVVYSNNTNYGTAKVTVSGIGNYTGSIVRSFAITPQPIAKPSVETTHVYTGDEIVGFEDNEWYNIEGDNSGINAGVYTVTVSLKGAAVWEDESTDPLVIEWYIAPKPIEVPQPLDLVHTGFEQQGIPDGEGYVLSGDVTATDEGTYTAMVKLANRVNYVWADGSISAKSVEWTIGPERYIDVPEPIEGLIYNGEEQQGVLDGEGYTLEGATAVNAGTYTAKASLTPGYHWASGEDSVQRVSWAIGKKPIPVPEVEERVYSGSYQTAFDDVFESGGRLFTWGTNSSGQLGIGNKWDRDSRTLIANNAMQVVFGNGFMAYLTVDGDLYMCGTMVQNSKTKVKDYGTTPVFVLGNVQRIAAGKNHIVALTNAGDVYAWGANDHGQLGAGNTTNSATPVFVRGGIKEIGAGNNLTMILGTDGNVYACGASPCDGYTITWDESTPSLKREGVAHIALRVYDGRSSGTNLVEVVTVDNDGSLYRWGDIDVYCATVVHNGKKGWCVETISSKDAYKIAEEVNEIGAGWALTTDNQELSWVLPALRENNSYGFDFSGDITTGSCSLQKRLNMLERYKTGYSYGGSSAVIVYYESDMFYYWGDCIGKECAERIAQIAPMGNYCWEGGSVDPVSMKWTLGPKIIDEVSVSVKDLVYTGEEQRGVLESEYYTLSGQVTGVDAGTYAATAELNNPNYAWSDGTTEPKNIIWAIAPKPVDISNIVNEGLRYTGSMQVGVKSGEGYSILYNSKATARDIGDYKAVLRLLDENYIWADGTIDDKEIDWSISPAYYDESSLVFWGSAEVYDGNPHELWVTGVPEGVEVTYENNGQVEPGEYTVIAHFSGDYEHYEPITDMEATLTILKIPVAVPQAVEGLSYTGFEQMGVEGAGSTAYEVTNAAAVDAGTYSAQAQLKDKAHYAWDFEDEYTSDDQVIPWVISPASIWDVEVAFPQVTYTGAPHTPSANVAFGGHGLIADEDYNISYENNVNPGWANVTLVGKKNYSGIRLEQFQIVSAATEEESIQLQTGVESAESELAGIVISESGDGSDVPVGQKWLTREDYESVIAALSNAGKVLGSDAVTSEQFEDATASLAIAQELLSHAKTKEEDKASDPDETTSSDEAPAVGSAVLSGGATFRVLPGDKVSYLKAPQGSSVIVPATVALGGKVYQVSDIAAGTFKGNGLLTKVVIGANVLTVGESAFENCAKLKTVSIGSNVQVIGAKAFLGCKSLKKVVIPAGVKQIGKAAFKNCKSLKNLVFKTKKLTKKSVGAQAFKGTHKKMKVKCGSKHKAYKKWLRKKGVSKKAKIIK